MATDDFSVDLAAKRVTTADGEVRSRQRSGTSSRCSSATPAGSSPSGSCSRRSNFQYEKETNYLRVYLAQIRAKLEPDPARPRYFITEARMGYRFEAGARAADGRACSPGCSSPTTGPTRPSALEHAAGLVGAGGTVSVINVVEAQAISSRLATVSDAQRARQDALLGEAERLLARRNVRANLIRAAGDPSAEILSAAGRRRRDRRRSEQADGAAPRTPFAQQHPRAQGERRRPRRPLIRRVLASQARGSRLRARRRTGARARRSGRGAPRVTGSRAGRARQLGSPSLQQVVDADHLSRRGLVRCRSGLECRRLRLAAARCIGGGTEREHRGRQQQRHHDSRDLEEGMAVPVDPRLAEEERHRHRLSRPRRGRRPPSSALPQSVAENPVERTGHTGGIERADQQRRVADLAIPHEAPELLFQRPFPMGRLLLVRGEGAEPRCSSMIVSTAASPRARINSSSRLTTHTKKPSRSMSWRVRSAPSPARLSARRNQRSSPASQRPARRRSAPPGRSARAHSDRLRAADRHDGHPLGGEIQAPARGQCLDREPIADASTSTISARDGRRLQRAFRRA